MKTLIGIGIIIAGVVLGLYLGLWWAFIGGIVVIVKQFQQPHFEALTLALGVVRILSASLIGWGTFMFCTFVGGFFISYDRL